MADRSTLSVDQPRRRSMDATIQIVVNITLAATAIRDLGVWLPNRPQVSSLLRHLVSDIRI